jgi:hypothetical protein
VKIEPASGVLRDASSYATKTVGDPLYPILLLQRVITINLQTMQIVRSFPSLGDLL